MVPWRVVAAQHVDLPTAHDGAVVARRVRQRRELQPLVATQERDAVVRDTLCVLPRHCDDKRLGVLRAAASHHEGGVADDGAPELARVGHGRVVHARRTCVHSAAASRGESEDVGVEEWVEEVEVVVGSRGGGLRVLWGCEACGVRLAVARG